MILAYNPECEPMDPDSTYKPGETSKCLVGIYDINGNRGPNKFGVDVIGFNGAKLIDPNSHKAGCIAEVDGICFASLGVSSFGGMYESEFNEKKAQLGISYDYCQDGTGSCEDAGDMWARGVENCGGVSKVASKAQLIKLVSSDKWNEELYSQLNYQGTGNGFYVFDNNVKALFLTPGGGYHEDNKPVGYPWANVICVE